MKTTFFLGEDLLNTDLCSDILKGTISVEISDHARKRIRNSSNHVQNIIDSNQIVYGVNTGFGPLCNVRISTEETKTLQENILKSHAVGVGKPIKSTLVRLMLLCKLHALAKGYSGIQIKTLERILFFFQNDILPIVPEKGSVGASGDLAPLAHLFLPLIGLGKVEHQGSIHNTNQLLEELQIQPIDLSAKEGLALINGTQFILAHAVYTANQMKQVLTQADVIGAIQIDALKGSIRPFKDELHAVRPFWGSQKVARTVKNVLEGSEIPNSHIHCNRVQDPYSLRCIPQVHGASWNAWKHLKELVDIELNSVTDNPVILENGESISGGNFHGQPLAMVLDYAKVAISEIGNISDRRIYLSLEGEKVGLPKLLLKETGLNSGFMILQYTTAALASENKALCFPNSADSIPTSLGQEDHVSMGSISGRKCLEVLENVEHILSIELIVALQALEFSKPLKSSSVIEDILMKVREEIPHFSKDEVMTGFLDKSLEFIKNNEIQNILDQHQISLN